MCMNTPCYVSEHVCVLPCRCICTRTLHMWGKPAGEGVCVCTWVGVNGLCGDGNLHAAYWPTDVEEGGASFEKRCEAPQRWGWRDAETWEEGDIQWETQWERREGTHYRNNRRDMKSWNKLINYPNMIMTLTQIQPIGFDEFVIKQRPKFKNCFPNQYVIV